MRLIVNALSGETRMDSDYAQQAVPSIAPGAPITVSRYQLRRWLRVRHGISWNQVEALADALPEPARSDALDWLAAGADADRTDPLVKALALALPLGITPETVDAALAEAWAEAAAPAPAPAASPTKQPARRNA